MKKNIFISKLSLLLLLLVLIVVGMGIYLKYGIIQADASYYLGTSFSILDGRIPYKDFKLEYTPLSFYIMCIPIWLSNGSYNVSLLTMYFFHILNGILVYFICRQHLHTKFISAYISLLSIMVCFLLGGEVYVLEPFVLFFGLLSIYFLYGVKSYNIFIAGLLCSCSFLCKQYGIGFVFLSAVYLLITGKKSILTLFSGFLTGLVITCLFFIINGVSLSQLSIISGAAYNKTGGIYGIMSLWRTVLTIIPLLLVSFIILIIKFKSIKKNPLIIVSIFAICGFMLQWYVRTFWHYIILLVPFCFFIIAECYFLFESKKLKRIYLILLILSALRPGYVTASRFISVYNENYRYEQVKSATELLKFIPKNTSNVYSSGDALPINMLNGYMPPLFQKYGYKNGFVESGEETYELILNSDYCIISDFALEADTVKYNYRVKQYLTNEFVKTRVKPTSLDGVFYIYKRKS